MIVGTAGHIDHGKTALVGALTGVDTDRLKEEKARGISIDLGFAYLPTPDGSVMGFVDVPGHERFIHAMLAGATGIDFLLLVVAADDGVMPQTREHLAIVDLLGVEHGVVAITKADLADAERRNEVAAEIDALVSSTCLAGCARIPCSVVTGEGLGALKDALFEAAAKHRARSSAGRFRLAVDRSFTLAGAGTVVTGTVLSGAVSVGDRIVLSPSGLFARVRSLHAQNRPVERGHAGERCALNLVGDGIAKDAVARGDMALEAELHAPTDRIDARLKVLASEVKPITQWMPVRLHHAASDTPARIVLLGDEPLRPGEEAYVQLVLERPIAAAAGDRFVIRDTSARRTIGGGRFIDLRGLARKRRSPERMAQLRAHALADPGEALSALLDTPPHHVSLSRFARDRALSAAQLEELTERLAIVTIPAADGVTALAAMRFVELNRTLVNALAEFHAQSPDLPGIGLERLRLMLEPRLPAPAFRAFLQTRAKASRVALDGAWVRLPSHEVRLSDADEQAWRQSRLLIGGESRFRPPRVRDIAGVLDMPEPDVRRLFKLLSRMGKVDEVAHDHFFLRDTVSELVDIAHHCASRDPMRQFTAAQFRDCLDNGRKVAIQILEFFDRHGVTIRRGDLRRINPHRLDLFRPSAWGEGARARQGGEASPVGRPDFKSGRGREPVSGGFDSHSLPPSTGSAG